MRFLISLMIFAVWAIVTSMTNASPGFAQDRYWQEFDIEPTEDGFRSGWDYRLGFYYVSPGLLEGEYALARLSFDRAKLSNPSADDIEVEIQALVDVPGTFGETPIQYLLDIGFCDNADSGCTNYYWITNTLGPFTAKVGQKLGDWRDPGNSLGLSQICYPSFAAYEAGNRLEKCPLERMEFISVLGRVPLRDFIIRGRSDNLDERRLALRFQARGGEFQYAKFHVKTLLSPLKPDRN